MDSRLLALMERYECTLEDAYRYLEYREEGYSAHVAAVMAGLIDPYIDQD